MEASFKTILNEGRAEIIEKKSSFIATARPVKTEDDAKKFIEEIRKKYWDATHNVFAYQLGTKNELQRFSDDGEPQGTAGKSVLTVLSGEDIKNCCVVVTRYFGGTLLGTGGLVRAYGKAAKEGVLCGGIVQVHSFEELSVTVDYTLQGKIQYLLIQGLHIVRDTIFTDKVEFIILVETEKSEALQTEITNISSAKAEIMIIGTVSGAWVDGTLKELEG